MLLSLRVSLPDRPGTLAKITRVFGAAGADILQMTVLERAAGRALDEFTASCPTRANRDRLVDGLETLPGTMVEAAWPTTTVPDAHPELDLLGHVAANPHRAIETLVDATPNAMRADWSFVARDGRSRIVHASTGAPRRLVPPDMRPLRSTAFAGEGGVQFAAVPILLAEYVLFVAREAGPAFHRVELARLTGIVEVVRAITVVKGAAAMLG